MTPLKELRCSACKRLLAKAGAGQREIEIKCGSCNEVNRF